MATRQGKDSTEALPGSVHNCSLPVNVFIGSANDFAEMALLAGQETARAQEMDPRR
jgi:hypothetical protein